MELSDNRGEFSLTFETTVPADRAVELATLRPGRLGGPTVEDERMRARLYQLVGSIAVAGGHVEAAMKRILLTFPGGDTAFVLADYQWSELHKKLLHLCDGEDRRSKDLAHILGWAEKRRIRDRRNDVIHAAWWPYHAERLVAGRWPKKQGGMNLIMAFEDLERLEVLCWEYVRKLDELLGENWPRAMFLAKTTL